MGSSHGARGKNPKQRFTELQEMALVSVRKTEMAAKVKGALGFHKKSPLYIAILGDLGTYDPQHFT
jgi:hypothetical protein